MPRTSIEHFDVLIIGAGISGIGAGHHLQKNCPEKSFAILEGRDSHGGTWDLFRYPGIRSDSDMYTFGYSFKPWTNPKSIAAAQPILDYLGEAICENNLQKKIRFNHQLKKASWDNASASWTVEIACGEDRPTVIMRCNFLFMCTGYFNYSQAYRPDFLGEKDFPGPIIHPQFWPDDLDYHNKRVLIIGSGATAVTLVPNMADKAAHITLLQRSPTYMYARPSEDLLANNLRALLPDKIAYRLIRSKNIIIGLFQFTLATKLPWFAKKWLLHKIKKSLGANYDVTSNFTPRYNPWDQRVCLVPDGDFFDSIKGGKASIETGLIDRFTESGILLTSGKLLPADVIVCATGLKMEIMSGVSLFVDGKPINLADTISYKGFMYSGIPNLASSFGYSNASWTLKSDLIGEYVCRLLTHMDKTGNDYCIPTAQGVVTTDAAMMNLKSGYVLRAMQQLPKQGINNPWRTLHNYLQDILLLRYLRLEDGVLRFGKAPAAHQPITSQPYDSDHEV